MFVESTFVTPEEAMTYADKLKSLHSNLKFSICRATTRSIKPFMEQLVLESAELK